MRNPFSSGEFYMCRDGSTEPKMPAADEVNQDDVATLREIESALEYVESESKHSSDHDIAICTDPISVGKRRQEFLAADPSDSDDAA